MGRDGRGFAACRKWVELIRALHTSLARAASSTMAADRRQLLSDSSASAVSLQYSPSVQPLYPSLSDTRVESALHLPGSAIAEPADTVVGSVEEDSVSLSSSISTTTDDQAALLRKDRLNSLEGPLASAAGGSDGGGGTRARRIKSAAVSSKRKRGGQHLSSEELERTAPFTASVPRTGISNFLQ